VRHLKKSKIFSPERLRDNVFPNPAVALDGPEKSTLDVRFEFYLVHYQLRGALISAFYPLQNERLIIWVTGDRCESFSLRPF